MRALSRARTLSDPPGPQPSGKMSAAPAVQEGETAKMFDPANLPAPGTAPPAVAVTKELDTMWDVPLKTLQGKDAKLSDFKGKALMIVNVASKCGNTPQYATLEALQKKYEAKGFTVLGFPCNQFGGQEPGTAEEIQTFCAVNYGVTSKSSSACVRVMCSRRSSSTGTSCASAGRVSKACSKAITTSSSSARVTCREHRSRNRRSSR